MPQKQNDGTANPSQTLVNDEIIGQPWTRKHDDPSSPVVPAAPRTLYPQSLEELIRICTNHDRNERIRAAGSHWALSEAAISDYIFVETHDPNNIHPAMGRTLYEVVPPCLNPAFVDALAREVVPPFDQHNVGETQGFYPVHIETGKRVYQLYSELDFLYSELDFGDDEESRSLARLLEKMGNPSYLGPWGFRTLGNAGGQTVFGALTTGTHGGDFGMPPIADSVLAIHLVADGSKHYWIEPLSVAEFGVPLTADQPLKQLYGDKRFGGSKNFEIIRDDDVFNAVLVSVGRFGIVYSIVLAAVRQYSLHVERRLTTWEEIKDQIRDPMSDFYRKPTDGDENGTDDKNRYLEIAISVTPHENFTRHLAGVTKRWNVPAVLSPDTKQPVGRLERRGTPGAEIDPQINARRFSHAGNSYPYSPDPERPGLAKSPGFLERACSDADFVKGATEQIINELQEVVINTFSADKLLLVAAVGGPGLVPLLPWFLLILELLKKLLPAILPHARQGEAVNALQKGLLDNPLTAR